VKCMHCADTGYLCGLNGPSRPCPLGHEPPPAFDRPPAPGSRASVVLAFLRRAGAAVSTGTVLRQCGGDTSASNVVNCLAGLVRGGAAEKLAHGWWRARPVDAGPGAE
jgi:hypothetical protein